MQIIPITDVPSQILQVSLSGQPCSIHIKQKSTGLYLDLYINNALTIGGVICQNLNRIVRDSYLGLVGDLMFEDTQGNDDPSYGNGLGTRFLLCYLQPSDLWGATS